MRISGILFSAALLVACGKSADAPVEPKTDPVADVAVEPEVGVSTLQLADFETAADYDPDWTLSDKWLGEFPAGFAVVFDNVTVPARSAPISQLPADESCPLQAGANYQAWNEARNDADNVQYFSATKAFPVTMTEAAQVEYVGPDGIATLDLAAGDQLIYQHYLSEGFAAFDYEGQQVELNEAELRDISDLSSQDVVEEQWLHLTCADGVARWVLYAEALETEGVVRSPLVGPGETGDLTEEEVEELIANIGTELEPLSESE